jgi:hypothetical protein
LCDFQLLRLEQDSTDTQRRQPFAYDRIDEFRLVVNDGLVEGRSHDRPKAEIEENRRLTMRIALALTVLLVAAGAVQAGLVDPGFEAVPFASNSPVTVDEVGAGWQVGSINGQVRTDGDFVIPDATSGTTVPNDGILAWSDGGSLSWIAQVIQDNQATTDTLTFRFDYTVVDSLRQISLVNWQIWGLSGTFVDFGGDTPSDDGWVAIDSGTIDTAAMNGDFSAAGDPFPELVAFSKSVDFGAGYDYIGVRFDAKAVGNEPQEFAALGYAEIVPEPATLALLGFGAAGFLSRRRR